MMIGGTFLHTYLVAICFLSFTESFSEPENQDHTATELLTSLQTGICAYVQLCYRNATEGPVKKSQYNEPCCFPCSCFDDCLMYNNCCPDKFLYEGIVQNYTVSVGGAAPALDNNTRQYDQTVENDTVSKVGVAAALDNNVTQYLCVRNSFLPNRERYIKTRSYYMIYTCDRAYNDLSTIARCEDPLDGSVLDIAPVTVLSTNITYKNVYCMICNFQSNAFAVFWEPVLTCFGSWFVKIQNGFESADDIPRYLKENDLKLCNLLYKIPSEVKKTETLVEECVAVDVSTCNMTGEWKIHNQTLRKACDTFSIPVKASYGGTALIFKNVACLLCNGLRRSKIPSLCRKPVILERQEISLNFYYQDIEKEPLGKLMNGNQTKSHAQPNNTHDIKLFAEDSDNEINQTEGSFSADRSCSDGLVLDKHKGICRYESCPLDHQKVLNECRPLYARMVAVQFQVTAKVYVEPDNQTGLIDNEIINTHFNTINGLMGNLNSSLCQYSIWTKSPNRNRELPYVLFSFVFSLGKRQSIQYSDILGTFQFLHTSQLDLYHSGIKQNRFYFADHVFVDWKQNEAIDVKDNTTLLKLEGRDTFCRKPLFISETRFCHGLRLNSSEYKEYEMKRHLPYEPEITKFTWIYIPRAGVYAYWGEYFNISGTDQLFVCTERYNNGPGPGQPDYPDGTETNVQQRDAVIKFTKFNEKQKNEVINRSNLFKWFLISAACLIGAAVPIIVIVRSVDLRGGKRERPRESPKEH